MTTQTDPAGASETSRKELKPEGSNKRTRFKKMLRPEKQEGGSRYASSVSDDGAVKRPEKWSMGIMNDSQTEEVPGQ